VVVQDTLPHLLGPADGLVRSNTWAWVLWAEERASTGQ
jgi:hypothetical protein